MAEQTKARETAWLQARELTPEKIKLAQQALEEIRAGEKVFEAIRHNPLADGYLSKNILVTVYRELVRRGEWKNDPALLAKIRMKPMRTLSVFLEKFFLIRSQKIAQTHLFKCLGH